MNAMEQEALKKAITVVSNEDLEKVDVFDWMLSVLNAYKAAIKSLN